MNEWQYTENERPQLVINELDELVWSHQEACNKDELITWIFDEGTFRPSAKLVGEKRYSIITDYLGTPTQMFDEHGELSWEVDYDIYGKIRKLPVGSLGDCPFRYQGQYEDVETGLYYNRFRYYSPDTGTYVSQDPIRLAGSDNFYGYVNDTNYWIDPNGLMAFGSGKGVHVATVNIFDNKNNLVSSEVFRSGNMTASEKALGFPQSTLATHTEARAVKKIPLQPGHRMEIIGQYPPCNSCKGKMRGATTGGATIDYKWTDEAGNNQYVRFENNKKILDSTSKNPKLHLKNCR